MAAHGVRWVASQPAAPLRRIQPVYQIYLDAELPHVTTFRRGTVPIAAYLRHWNPGYMAWYKPLGTSKEMEESFPAFQHLWRLSDHYVITMSSSGGYEQVDQKSVSAIYECVVVSYIYQPRGEIILIVLDLDQPGRAVGTDPR